ncbi:MAG: peptidoglycan DD-metalloendopeptidase family protein, partial [bacterium]|nr:peptidoglycan DD-metalloendopeptidase family protein [bacterium]
RLNPLNRIGLGRSASGGSSSSSSSSGSNGSGNKLVSLFMKLPLVVKVKVVVTASVITILAVAFFLIISVLGGTTAAIVAATCGATSYDIGSADATLFLKSMDDPMGDASYEVTSIYGWRNCDYHGHEFHPAVDLAGPSGTSIHAVSDGVISEIGSNGSFGNSITINHNETFYTMYNHLSGFKSGLKKGDTVKQGDIIGYEGSTGTSTGAHLDFRLFDKDKNPISINAYFGYSDKGYESCVNPNEKQPASECDLGSTGSARKLGSDGFTEIANKTNEFTDSSCCSSYSSSVSVGEVSGLPKILTQEFVNGAVQSQSKYGVPASLTLAQLVLESGGEYEGGVSELAYKCKNLFGIKGKGTAGVCFYNTGEQTASGSSFSIVAGFRKYNTYAESIEDHAKVLTSDWYKRCTKDAKTADDWARAIKKCGYATDVSYANKIISIMKEYNLYQYDDSSVFGSGSGSCDTGETGDIVDKANDEYDKWNKASSSERTEMLKNYMEACGLGRTCNHWCSGFVSYILKETGRLNNLKNFNCMADSYTKVEPATHHKQGSGYTPKAGDIIVFDYTGNGSGDHVAIVESVKGKTIHYIGGNQTSSNSASCWSNAITKVTVPLDSKNILDFVTIG